MMGEEVGGVEEIKSNILKRETRGIREVRYSLEKSIRSLGFFFS
jgi:hypothetical protein